jgi:hypothetical protein
LTAIFGNFAIFVLKPNRRGYFGRSYRHVFLILAMVNFIASCAPGGSYEPPEVDFLRVHTEKLIADLDCCTTGCVASFILRPKFGTLIINGGCPGVYLF